MVKIHFKLSEVGTVSLDIAGTEKLEEVLERCAAKAGIEIGGVIAVRNGRVITGHASVDNGDEIDIFPAISGG